MHDSGGMLRYALVLILTLVIREAWAAEPAPYRPIEELDRVVAIVNDDVIVLSELENRVRTTREELGQSGVSPPPVYVLRKQVLERLVLERLQLQVARSTGIRVEDDRLNKAVEDVARRNGMSLGEFRDVLEAQDYNFGKFRDDIRNQIAISLARRRQVSNRVQVTSREIENFLAMEEKRGGSENEYRIAHILIAVSEDAEPEVVAAARERSEGIVSRLRAGEDFARTAAAVSQGQQALEGGDLGWRKESQLPTLFTQVVPTMAPGDIFEPISSPSGFHIIKLVDIRGGARHILTQTKTRQILVRPDELTSEEDARLRLDQLKFRIENNEDFGELARAHSDDRATAASGGDLGWLSPGDTVPAFEEVVDRLAEGEVSDPFKTEFGWHIVQVSGRRQHDSTKEVQRANAVEQIRRRKTEEEIQSWLRQLRDEAFVEYRLDE